MQEKAKSEMGKDNIRMKWERTKQRRNGKGKMEKEETREKGGNGKT